VARALRRVVYWLAVVVIALALLILMVGIFESNDVGKLGQVSGERFLAS
jgi:uncharacterized protein involved in outer membrane biogenesis